MQVLGRAVYGKLAILLATSSLINGLLFHISRNAIVYAPVLDRSSICTMNLWFWGSLATVPAVALSGWLGSHSALEMGAIWLFVMSQSIYERRLEYCRSHLALRDYLYVSCLKSLWVAAGLATLVLVNGQVQGHLPAFLVLALSPLLACVGLSSNARREPRRMGRKINVKAAIQAMAVTLAVSYPFIADAAVKYACQTLLSPSAFGEYAALSDIMMPALFVLGSAAAWDFVPKLVQGQYASPLSFFVEKSFLALALFVLATLIALFAMHRLRDVILYTAAADMIALFLAIILAVYLSTLVFPFLILAGRKALAAMLSSTSIIAIVTMSVLKARAVSDWMAIPSAPCLLLMINGVIVLFAVWTICRGERHGRRVRQKMRAICQ